MEHVDECGLLGTKEG